MLGNRGPRTPRLLKSSPSTNSIGSRSNFPSCRARITSTIERRNAGDLAATGVRVAVLAKPKSERYLGFLFRIRFTVEPTAHKKIVPGHRDSVSLHNSHDSHGRADARVHPNHCPPPTAAPNARALASSLSSEPTRRYCAVEFRFLWPRAAWVNRSSASRRHTSTQRQHEPSQADALVSHETQPAEINS
jgi:hypothetical protein